MMFDKLLSLLGVGKKAVHSADYYEDLPSYDYVSKSARAMGAHGDFEKLRQLEAQLKGLPSFVRESLGNDGELPPVVPCRDMLPELYMRYGRWQDAESVIMLCISCGAYGHTEYRGSRDHNGTWVLESGDEQLAILNQRREAASAALSYLVENPGVLQSKIYKAEALSGVDHDALVWFCRSSHQIRKEKDGKTNRIYVADGVLE